MKILHLIDSFEFSDNVRQLKILGPATRTGAASVEICCLGPETPALKSLRGEGVLIHALHWTRWFDPSALFHLRAVVDEAAPDVIHVWGLAALRTLALVARSWLRCVVFSGDLPAKSALTWWDRRLLEQIPVLAVSGESERQRLTAAGIASLRLQVMPPPLESNPAISAATTNAIQIACIEESYRHAIWAFDFVRLLFPEATLQLAGVGAGRADLQALANGIDCVTWVHFLDNRVEVAEIIDRVDVVWIPTLTNHGRQTALEAMARGRPIVASDVPCMREVIDDGVTGFLVAPGEVVQLARRTRMVLDDMALRTRIGAAARAFVERQFPLARTLDRWRELYARVAA